MKAEEIFSRVCAFLPVELRGLQRRLDQAGQGKLDAAVHDARKSIKKLRAVMRLAKTMAPEKALASVDTPLRNAAHVLGPARDHLVRRETARRVCRQGEPRPPESAAPPIRPLLQRARGELLKASAALVLLLQEGLDAKGARKGLRRIYQRARKARKRAAERPTDENLHAWRRRAKDLLYVLDLLEGPQGPVKKLQRLTQLLGEDHDLATFLVHHRARADADEFGRLLQRAQKRRLPLQRKAFRIGERVFSDGPRAFVRHALK